jgi:hypothetical protein
MSDIVTMELSGQEQAVILALRELSYGTVEVTKHDSRIVQIQKTEKMRF